MDLTKNVLAQKFRENNVFTMKKVSKELFSRNIFKAQNNSKNLVLLPQNTNGLNFSQTFSTIDFKVTIFYHLQNIFSKSIAIPI